MTPMWLQLLTWATSGAWLVLGVFAFSLDRPALGAVSLVWSTLFALICALVRR